MRLGILIRDAEYRDALVEKLSSYDNDLFVNVLNGSDKDTSESLILTDLQPDDLDKDILAKVSSRTVFLSSSEDTDLFSSDDLRQSFTDQISCYKLFKYSSVPSIISDLSLIYNNWQGKGCGRSYSAKMIAVCSESDSVSSVRCMALARQIIYRYGGKVLVSSLGYINDYGRETGDRINRFARLMYSIRTGRERVSDSFTYQDSYGVSALLLPPGQNPMAYLEEDELRSIVKGLAARFDSVILDIGTCFRKENISLMKDADRIIFFENGRRQTGITDMLGNFDSEKLIRIKLNGETEEAHAIDDAVAEIYGTERNDDHKGEDYR